MGWVRDQVSERFPDLDFGFLFALLRAKWGGPRIPGPSEVVTGCVLGASETGTDNARGCVASIFTDMVRSGPIGDEASPVDVSPSEATRLRDLVVRPDVPLTREESQG